MKTSLKILLLVVAIVVMNGCSAQKRAQRQVRRAVGRCPELVQVKAHLIDTFLTAPTFADVATVPMATVATYDTIYAATPHGTVVVSLSQSDSSLRVGFVAAPQNIHYRDTIEYAQVVIEPKPQSAAVEGFWAYFIAFTSGLGAVAVLFLLIRFLRKKIL